MTTRTCQRVSCVSHRAGGLLSPHSSKDKCHKRRLAGLQGTREGLLRPCVGLDSIPSKKLYEWGRDRRAESKADTGYWGCHSRYCKVKSTQLVTFYCDQELLKLSWQLPQLFHSVKGRWKARFAMPLAGQVSSSCWNSSKQRFAVPGWLSALPWSD